MGRFAPDGFLRLRQVLPGSLNLTFGGAEANVAASLAQLGASARFVTALPQNPIADACVGFLAGLGVDTSAIVRSKNGRLGLYFFENGANQRPGNVTYDRGDSSISLTAAKEYSREAAFDGATWFHTTGIAPSLSQLSADATLQAVKKHIEGWNRHGAVACQGGDRAGKYPRKQRPVDGLDEIFLPPPNSEIPSRSSPSGKSSWPGRDTGATAANARTLKPPTC